MNEVRTRKWRHDIATTENRTDSFIIEARVSRTQDGGIVASYGLCTEATVGGKPIDSRTGLVVPSFIAEIIGSQMAEAVRWADAQREHMEATP